MTSSSVPVIALVIVVSAFASGCGRLNFDFHLRGAADGSISIDSGFTASDAGDIGTLDGGAVTDADTAVDAGGGGADAGLTDGAMADAGMPDAGQCVDPGVSGLMVHLRFDETLGVMATDSSGNGHHGTLSGGASWVPGRIGNAVDFDGVNDQVNAGSAASIDNLTTLSMCAWVITRSFPDTWPAVADKSGDSYTGGWNFYVDRDGEFGFLTNRRKFAEGGNIVRGQWTHICASWDGSTGFGGIELYLDGASIPHGRTGSNGGGFDSDASRDLAVGRVAGGGLEFDGVIDDYQLYDRVLAPAEIQQIYDCGAS